MWEAAVKRTKTPQAKQKVTYEEVSVVLTQVEVCVNSRPLVPLNSVDDDGIQGGHFLIGQPLMAFLIGLLRRWHLSKSSPSLLAEVVSGEYLLTGIILQCNLDYLDHAYPAP